MRFRKPKIRFGASLERRMRTPLSPFAPVTQHDTPFPREEGWVQSAGGPLILGPRSRLQEWEGAFPPSGDRVVEARFRFFSESDPATDYDRACDVEQAIEPIPIGSGMGIVFGDEPSPTTWLPSDLLIVRVILGDQKDDFSAIAASYPADAWEHNFVYDSQETDYLLFDSACAGTDSDAEEEGVPIQLEMATYNVSTLEHQANGRTMIVLHRFGLPGAS